MKNIRALVKECALRVLKEDLSSTDHDRLSGEIYAKLQEHGFQTKGDEPNQYSEYYLWNFATVQCGVRPDHVYVERYYDSERMDDMHRKSQKIPLPDHYDQNYVNTVVALCVKWQRSIKGDESLFGGMDDITEVNHTKDERGKWVIAVGAPGSVARMKAEYPDTISAMVAALTKRFGPPSPDLHTIIQDAAMIAASKLLGKEHGIGVKSLAQAAEEAYWEQNKQVSENTTDDPKDAYYVEYVGERVGEKPFKLGNSDRKFQYVNGKYPDGTVDISVYSFAGDLCYGYKAFRSMMGIEEGFDPTSCGPNPAATEGETVYDPYTSMNAKMCRMEEGNAKWEAEGRCGECGTTNKKCNCKIIKRIQAYRDLKKKAEDMSVRDPDSKELPSLIAQVAKERPWVISILRQAGYGVQGGHYMRENMGRYAQLAGATDLKDGVIPSEKNPEMKRVNALIDKDETCNHPNGFAFSGKVPGTGVPTCHICGATKPENRTQVPRLGQFQESAETKTFKQIQNEEDPDGTNHDLTLTCAKCGNTQTCRCSKPKRKFNGVCPKCSQVKEDRFDKFRRELGAERVDEFLAKFGLGPNYKPQPTKTYPCSKCKKGNAVYKEEGVDCDGGQNEMVLNCPDCGHMGSLNESNWEDDSKDDSKDDDQRPKDDRRKKWLGNWGKDDPDPNPKPKDDFPTGW